MKLLVVAHPDDEILWFNPEEFDRIVIVFGNFGDGRGSGGRHAALAEHPLAHKIDHLDIAESNFWRDPAKRDKHERNFTRIVAELRSSYAPAEVTTHNANGEYGHADHILVHKACMNAFDCPVNGKNPKLYRKIRKVYENHGCWTWET